MLQRVVGEVSSMCRVLIFHGLVERRFSLRDGNNDKHGIMARRERVRKEQPTRNFERASAKTSPRLEETLLRWIALGG